MEFFKLLLLPFSWLYGMAVYFRNKAYDLGYFHSQEASLPAIVIGNLNTGGTGKTPHCILLSRCLSELDPAILSRGYGRTTKGFREVKENSDGSEVGDEPLLYKRRTSNKVYVCEDRIEGIKQIKLEGHKGIVLLDDAFQHRKLIGDFNILLIPASKPFWKDHYLPSGDLRDHRNQVMRADAIIFTGFQGDQKEKLLLQANVSKYSDSPLFWSETNSLDLIPAGQNAMKLTKDIILVTGIAKPGRVVNALPKEQNIIKHFKYRDHHSFQESDIEQWQAASRNHDATIVTTEKDWMRLKGHRKLAERTWLLPIDVEVSQLDKLIRCIHTHLGTAKKG
ncbi:MAG: tetraacyldisaccharide 4'-kinase [Bacteroidota bacterium]